MDQNEFEMGIKMDHQTWFSVKKQLLLLLLPVFCAFGSVQAQDKFTKIYQSPTEQSFAFDICQTMDAGFVACGFIEVDGNKNLMLLRIDSVGAVVWQRSIGGGKTEYGRGVTEASDGSIYATGWSKDESSGEIDLLYVKCDADGNLVWSKLFGGLYSDHGWHIAEDFNSVDLIITGYSYNSTLGIVSNLIMRINPDGDTLKTRMFGGVGKDYGHYMEFSDNGYVICGHTSSFGEDIGVENNDMQVFEIDTNFNIIWSRAFGLAGREEGNAIVRNSEGGYFVAGVSDSYGGANNIVVLKIASNGDLIWSKSVDMPGESESLDLSCNELDEITLVGFVEETTLFIARLDQNGVLITAQEIDGVSQERGYAITKCAEGFIACGHSFSFGEAGMQSTLISRYRYDDLVVCKSHASTPVVVNRPIDERTGLFASPSGLVYKGSLNENVSSTLSELDVCFSELKELDGEQFRIFPQPANDHLWVQWSDSETSDINYIIYNMAGETMQQGKWTLKSSPSPYKIKLKQLPAGNYFIHFNLPDGKIYTAKFGLVR